jgi:hypothetical protein
MINLKIWKLFDVQICGCANVQMMLIWELVI